MVMGIKFKNKGGKFSVDLIESKVSDVVRLYELLLSTNRLDDWTSVDESMTDDCKSYHEWYSAQPVSFKGSDGHFKAYVEECILKIIKELSMNISFSVEDSEINGKPIELGVGKIPLSVFKEETLYGSKTINVVREFKDKLSMFHLSDDEKTIIFKSSIYDLFNEETDTYTKMDKDKAELEITMSCVFLMARYYLVLKT